MYLDFIADVGRMNGALQLEGRTLMTVIKVLDAL